MRHHINEAEAEDTAPIRRKDDVRIPHLTAPELIAAFFGDDVVSAYDYTVTHEEFDHYDNEGPGEYYGVEVRKERGVRWDAGLDACKAAGVNQRSREGLALRLAAMYPEGAPPQAQADVERYLARKAAEHEAAVGPYRAQIEDAKVAVEQAKALLPLGTRKPTKEEHDRGYAAVKNSQPILINPLVDPFDLPDEARKLAYQVLGNDGTRLGKYGWSDIYRADGRYFVYLRRQHIVQAVNVTEDDSALLADYADRDAITGYRYHPDLYRLLQDLDREALICEAKWYTWFGGSLRADHTQGAHSHEHNHTAAETRQRLLDLLSKRSSDPRVAQAIALLADETSIVEIR